MLFLSPRMHLNYLNIETCHPIVLKACQIFSQMSILNTLLKSNICTQTLAPTLNLIFCFLIHYPQPK